MLHALGAGRRRWEDLGSPPAHTHPAPSLGGAEADAGPSLGETNQSGQGAGTLPGAGGEESSEASAPHVGVLSCARTCDAAPVGNPHRAEAVVGHGGDLPRAAGAVVVAVLLIGVRHRVGVVGVQVIAALRALETEPQAQLRALLFSLLEKQNSRALCEAQNVTWRSQEQDCCYTGLQLKGTT